jgi:signal peptidase I
MRSRLRSFVQLAVFVAVSFAVRASFADHYRVPSSSMEPTVMVGDHVIVNKAAYGIRVPTTTTYLVRLAEPARGDVVVLEGVEDPPIVLLKRVVAIGGDDVEVKDGHVFIDGVVTDARATGGPDFGPARVPDGSVLVLGDNRSNSRDGRTFGFVTRDRVLGRVSAVITLDGPLVYDALGSP